MRDGNQTTGRARVFRIGSKLIAKGMLALALGSAAPSACFADAGRDDYVYLKQSTFVIPIQVAPDRVNDIKELQLFVSTDRGRNWRKMQTARPSQQKFVFQAPSDGEYWFTLAYVDNSNNVEPANVRDEPPGLKIVLDTKAPAIDLQAMPREGNQASVAWRALDDQLDPASLRIEYQEAGETNWSELKTAKTPNGRRDWMVEPNKNYSVRATIKDRSGNTSVAKVDLPRAAAMPAPRATVAADATGPSRNFDIPPPPSMSRMPATEAPAVEAVPRPVDETNWMAAKPPAPPTAPTYAAPAATPTAIPTAAPAARRNVFDRNRPDLPADARKATVPSTANAMPAAGAIDDRNQFLATTNKAPIASSTKPPVRETNSGVVQASASTVEPPKPQPKKIPLIGSTRFAVNYDVKGVGPAGIGKVELYYTEDNGQSWKCAGEDPKKMPPFEVELPREGRYGLKVVVSSPAGHGQKPPIKGEAPSMVVEVDTTAPIAELFQPIPDTNGANDTMLISWSAKDAHMAPSPVSLYFAEFAEGPWYAIKTNLAGTGQYAWKVPEGMPHQVYLRLIARDLCDNVSMADTPKPVLIDMSKPSAEITDIAALPEKTSVR